MKVYSWTCGLCPVNWGLCVRINTPCGAHTAPLLRARFPPVSHEHGQVQALARVLLYLRGVIFCGGGGVSLCLLAPRQRMCQRQLQERSSFSGLAAVLWDRQVRAFTSFFFFFWGGREIVLKLVLVCKSLVRLLLRIVNPYFRWHCFAKTQQVTGRECCLYKAELGMAISSLRDLIVCFLRLFLHLCLQTSVCLQTCIVWVGDLYSCMYIAFVIVSSVFKDSFHSLFHYELHLSVL